MPSCCGESKFTLPEDVGTSSEGVFVDVTSVVRVQCLCVPAVLVCPCIAGVFQQCRCVPAVLVYPCIAGVFHQCWCVPAVPVCPRSTSVVI